MTTTTQVPNRLAQEKSPYLLQHAHNPVDWFPWGEDAFSKAKKEDKPIFLSIGYSTCHWCHVCYSRQEKCTLLLYRPPEGREARIFIQIEYALYMLLTLSRAYRYLTSIY